MQKFNQISDKKKKIIHTHAHTHIFGSYPGLDYKLPRGVTMSGQEDGKKTEGTQVIPNQHRLGHCRVEAYC